MTPTDAKKVGKDIAGSAGDKAAEAGDKASEMASKAGGQAQDAASRAAGMAEDQYDSAMDRVADFQNRIPDAASDTIKAGQRAYARSSEQLGRQVAKQPIEALLLAGAIGYLVGWAANRG